MRTRKALAALKSVFPRIVWLRGRYRVGAIRAILIVGMVTIGTIYQVVIPLVVAQHVTQHTFSPAEREILTQVEGYLNSVGTVRARFLQVSGTGAYAGGSVFLSRPGRMRLEYDPPSPILIVADGQHLIYHDAKLEQTSYIGLDATPAGLMLRVPIRLQDDVTVTDVQRIPGAIEVSLVQTGDPSVGELTLLFEKHPFALKQWRVKDAQGQIVTVSLYEAETGVKLNPDLFKFTDPNFLKPYNQ